MFEITRHETKRRMVGTGAVTVGLAGLALLFLAVVPPLISRGEFVAFVRTFPVLIRHAFGFKGVLATVLYQFGWTLLFGLYVAYSAGSMIARERDRFDVLLSAPVSRSSVLRQRFLSLVVSIIVINAVVAGVVYAGTLLINKPIALIDIVAVHALSIPYLLVCASVGLLLSVSTGKRTAQWGSIAIVLCLVAIDSIVAVTGSEWLAVLDPTRYYDPTAILLNNGYDLVGARNLLVVAVVLFVVSLLWFRTRDL